MLGALALAGCAAGATPTPVPITPAPVTAAPVTAAPVTAAPATAAPASAAAGGAAIEAKAVGNFPNILVAGQGMQDNLGADKSGFTVYYFTKDTKDSGASVCTDKCLANWPAVIVPSGTTPTAGTGVTGTLGTITRTDTGATQVTVNGLPIYYFIKDKAAGDTFGYYPLWGVVNADGTTVAPPSPAPASPSPGASPSP